MNWLKILSRAALAIPVVTTVVAAQVPRTLSYQGVLSDSTGIPKPDGSYSFMFSLYADSSGGSALWTETKNLPITRGLFSTSLGDRIPLHLSFDRPYWLGIVVGAEPELRPRLRLHSVGYSLRSSIADSIVDGAIGGAKIASRQVVRSLNGITDLVTLRAAGGATITASGDTITINAGSGGGNSGVQSLQSPTGTLTIANPNGPTTTVDVKERGIGTAQLGNASVTAEKISASNGSIGQVLKIFRAPLSDSVGWFHDGLKLPYYGEARDPGSAFFVRNSGAGGAGFFQVMDPSTTAAALQGQTDGNGPGVWGVSAKGVGLVGEGGMGVSGTGEGTGVKGVGVIGMYGAGRGDARAVAIMGVAEGDASVSVQAYGANYGVWGQGGNIGVYAHNTGGTSAGRDVYLATRTLAADMYGDLYVHGSVTKSGGSFKIDHPLDPANKYLYHSFVESPDMKNIYDGVVTLDGSGQATVTLPQWFEALNKDFRYQLTAIGAPGPNLYVAQKISGNTFVIAGGTAGMEVSWQVTGTRQDAWANAHRIPVEEQKPAAEKGHYEHPDLYGQPEAKSIQHAMHPEKQPMATQQAKFFEEMRNRADGNANSQK